MKLPDKPSNHASAGVNRTSEFTGAVGAGASPDWIQALADCLAEAYGSGHALLEVSADRIRLSLQRTIARIAIGVGVTVSAAVGLGAAVLAILRGARGGFTALWGGNSWLGDLTAGLVVLMIAVSAVALYLRAHTRRELDRLEAKYARIRNEPDSSRGDPRPAEDGAGVPGS